MALIKDINENVRLGGKKMPKINQEEYELLKNYNYIGVKWISRNKNGNLVISKVKPDKIRGKWLPNCPDEDWSELRNSHNYLFKFIQCEDEEAYSIQELIDNYEYKTGTFDWATAFQSAHHGESEETEVKKDKKWALNEIDNYLSLVRDAEERGALWFAKDVINQLDEPEVLSKEWINEKAVEIYADTADAEVHAVFRMRDLQNLLVPKQEEVDRAYKDGYEEGREHGFYKGYREGLANKGGEPKTVADVVTTFWKSYERLKEVMSMEVEEMEE